MAEFDEHAATYDQQVEAAISFSGRGHGFFLDAKASAALELVRARCGEPGGLLGLDFGCGTGELTRLLAPRYRRVLGLDVTLAGLLAARRSAPSSFVQYDGARLPFRDGAFDFAIASCVLHHVGVAARPAVLAEIARVVRPGGMVAAFEHNPWNPLTRWAVARCEFDRDAVLLRCGTARRLLLAAGLQDVSRAFILLFPWRRRLWQVIERILRALPLGSQYWVVGSRPAASNRDAASGATRHVGAGTDDVRI